MTNVNGMFRAMLVAIGVAMASVAHGSFELAAGESADIRFEGRTTFASRLVNGVETLGEADGGATSLWSPETRTDGWHTLSSGGETREVYVHNAGVRVEGGRLSGAEVVWSNDVTHVIRNWVYVPKGTTLSITSETVVKFCPETGIKVEDGGALVVVGVDAKEVYFTSVYDHTFGARIDCGRIAPAPIGSVYAESGAGTIVDHALLHTRGVHVEGLPGVTVHNTLAYRTTGMAHIPVTLSATRKESSYVYWEAVDGTAKYGVDYALNGGVLNWWGSTGQMLWLDIPLVEENVSTRLTFTIRFTAARGVNFADGEATITILDPDIRFPQTCGATASGAVRFDGRDTLGGVLVRGTETLGAADGASVREWDTTAEEDGWRTVTSGAAEKALLVSNTNIVEIAGGRLAETAVSWTNGPTYLVRNWVVVPDGTTLTLGTNTVVKFAPYTGIKVENGGTLAVDGADGTNVVLTSVFDDGVGETIDCGATRPGTLGGIHVESQAGAFFRETGGLETRGMPLPAYYPTVTIEDTLVIRNSGMANIPLLLSGTKDTPFSFDWEAVDGTAKFGEDFTLAKGTVTWTSSAQGTKWLMIPLVTSHITGELGSFTLRVTATHGMNVARYEAVVTIEERDRMALEWDIRESEAVRFDGRAGFGGRLVHQTEFIGTADGASVREWDTTAETNGWHEVADGDRTTELCVLNDELISFVGGRLSETNTVWTNAVTYLVRNWVVVPNGATLTITTNTVVKFCPDTGIRVENGGRLEIVGAEGKDVILTSVYDDRVGAEIDCDAIEEGELGNIQLESVENAVFTDNNYLQLRGLHVTGLPYLASTRITAFRAMGRVCVPFTVSGTRDAPFAVDWETVDGTAKFGEDFTANKGTVNWSKTSDGTGWFEIPLVKANKGETRTFKVRVVAGHCANVRDREVFITIREWGFENGKEESAAVRCDDRGDFGGKLVHGTEMIGAADGSAVRAWDTTGAANGWQELTSGTNTNEVCVLNHARVAVTGGRLPGGTVVWANDRTHLVRNWVVVPSGTTLSVTEGTVVKFCPGTGILVESGGVLDVVGTATANAIFTAVDDDTVGERIDCGAAVVGPPGGIRLVSEGATLTENNYMQIRGFHVSGLPYMTVNGTTAFRAKGRVCIPITVSGTRDKLFTADWVAVDGTAKLNEDYTLGGGTVTWSKTADGTRWIEIPLVTDHVTGEARTFTLKLLGGCGANVAVGEARVTIREHGFESLAWSGALTSATGRYDGRTSFGGKVVRGVEQIGEADGSAVRAWNTAQVADGWQGLASGAKTDDVYVMNSSAYALEGGRLPGGSVVWNNSRTHLVRNWVVVPSGTTLTIERGTVVKFCPYTGIKVEDGGRLDIVGEPGVDAILTSVYDHTVGVSVDCDRLAEEAWRGIAVQSAAAGFTDNTWVQVRGMTSVPGYGQVNLHDAIADRKSGMLYVLFTMTGSRDQAVALDWCTEDGTAVYSRDFTANGGRLTWPAGSEERRLAAIPLKAYPMSGERRSFTVRVAAAHGIAVGDGECTAHIHEFNAVSLAESVYTNGVASAGFAVDAAIGKKPLFTENPVGVAFDPQWSEDGASCEVTLTAAADGTTRVVRGGAVESGVTALDLTGLAAGSYELKHVIHDANGQVTDELTKTFAVVAPGTVTLHGGTLATNETWAADVVHVVYKDVFVPMGCTLAFERGTVVKFMTGAGIHVQAGADEVVANGVVFTHIDDDTVGGDTLLDGSPVEPVVDGYVLSGNMTIGGDSEVRYRTTGQSWRLTGDNLLQFVSGTGKILWNMTTTVEDGRVNIVQVTTMPPDARAPVLPETVRDANGRSHVVVSIANGGALKDQMAWLTPNLDVAEVSVRTDQALALGFSAAELTSAFGLLEELEPSVTQMSLRMGGSDAVASDALAFSIDFVVENGIDGTRQEAAERLRRFVDRHVQIVFQERLDGSETVIEPRITFGGEGLITVDFAVEKTSSSGFFRIRLD